MSMKVRYASDQETKIYKKPTGKREDIINNVLFGTWLGVVKKRTNGWLKVVTAGPDGWVHIDHTRTDPGLKVFFIDVGQGDAALIETKRHRILVDGGPNNNTHSYLKQWQYSYLIDNGVKAKLDAIFVSHFDADHFHGLTDIIDDINFEIGTIYHNGIARFTTDDSSRDPAYDTDLGQTDASGKPPRTKKNLLLTSFSTINDAKRLLRKGGLMTYFRKFLNAVVNAHKDGRLSSLQRLTVKDGVINSFSRDGLNIRILGPVPDIRNNAIRFKWFNESSYTRNGHSLVLKLEYGSKSILLGGDLNSYSETHLLDYYNDPKVFEVDVAKSCHHMSSDFTVEFMKAVCPHVTVVSSGDNESHSHPRADAIGAAGKYTKGRSPLVFSTELARSVKKGGDILYGMINLRTDGDKLVMAQMKEKKSGADIWDSYNVPFKPKRK